MRYKSVKLKEGVLLTVITDKKFKTENMSVTFISDKGEEAAINSALLTGVLSRSSKKFPSLMKINKALDDLYDAQLNADTARRGLYHIPRFTVSMLGNRYSIDGTDIRGGCLDMLYGVITEPDLKDGKFDAKTLITEKKQLVDAVADIKNSRGSYAVRQCTGELMAYEPLYSPRLGRLTGIDSVSAGSLTAFYDRVIKTSPVRIMFVGGDDDDRVYEFAEKLGDFLGDRQNYNVEDVIFKDAPDGLSYKTEALPVAQNVLCVGCTYDGDINDGQNAARSLFCEIFFQNPTSRLFENVREKLSLCYHCSAVAMTDLKKLIIYAGIDGKNREKAANEILKQTELIKKGVTEDEIKRCRAALKTELLAAADSPGRTAGWYGRQLLYGKEPESIAEFTKKLDSVTADDILRVASSVKPYLIYELGPAEANA